MLRLILVPALITLAVTLARLAGELTGGANSLFSREAGGKAALVGIVWLIPGFGFFWTALLPQLSIWILLTIAGGLVFGAIAAVATKPGGTAPHPPDPLLARAPMAPERAPK